MINEPTDAVIIAAEVSFETLHQHETKWTSQCCSMLLWDSCPGVALLYLMRGGNSRCCACGTCSVDGAVLTLSGTRVTTKWHNKCVGAFSCSPSGKTARTPLLAQYKQLDRLVTLILNLRSACIGLLSSTMVKRTAKSAAGAGKKRSRKDDEADDTANFFLLDEDDNKKRAESEEDEQDQETAEQKRVRLGKPPQLS